MNTIFTLHLASKCQKCKSYNLGHAVGMNNMNVIILFAVCNLKTSNRNGDATCKMLELGIQ